MVAGGCLVVPPLIVPPATTRQNGLHVNFVERSPLHQQFNARWHISTFLGPSTRRTLQALWLVYAAPTRVLVCVISTLRLAGSMHAGGCLPGNIGARARSQPRQSARPPQPPAGSPAAPQSTAPRSPPPRSAPAPSAACATRAAPAQPATTHRYGITLGRADFACGGAGQLREGQSLQCAFDWKARVLQGSLGTGTRDTVFRA